MRKNENEGRVEAFARRAGGRGKSLRGFVIATLLALAACSPGGGRDCRCILCDEFAVNLEVVDEAGDPVENFVVEFIFNGEPSGEPEDCTVESRDGSNRCGLGEETGYYHMIISAGGFEQLETAARVNEEGGGICCDSCARARDVRAIMRARGE